MVMLGEDVMASPGTEAPAGVTASNPAERRYAAAEIPEITGLRVSPGENARLVNISTTGLLLEGPQRFAPGQSVTVHFEGTLSTRQVRARVVRCQVSAITTSSTLHYQTAMAFAERLTLPREPADTSLAALSGDREPAVDPRAPQVANRW